MANHKVQRFPETRIFTRDVCSIGLQKHHIAAFIELDVTESREKISQYRKQNKRISFTAWLIKVISVTVKDFEPVAAWLRGKRELVIFDDIHVSITVEKTIGENKVPIPLIIEKAQEKSIESIAEQIAETRNRKLTGQDIVLHRKSNRMEQVYYTLPGFIRRYFWRYLTRHPRLAFRTMGNVSVTSIGMIGKVNGWFIPIAVHPVCFGIGKITKKPAVVNDQIVIREMLNMTVLLDHDVVDGAMMARFISRLSGNIEEGKEL